MVLLSVFSFSHWTMPTKLIKWNNTILYKSQWIWQLLLPFVLALVQQCVWNDLVRTRVAHSVKSLICTGGSLWIQISGAWISTFSQTVFKFFIVLALADLSLPFSKLHVWNSVKNQCVWRFYLYSMLHNFVQCSTACRDCVQLRKLKMKFWKFYALWILRPSNHNLNSSLCSFFIKFSFLYVIS